LKLSEVHQYNSLAYYYPIISNKDIADQILLCSRDEDKTDIL